MRNKKKLFLGMTVLLSALTILPGCETVGQSAGLGASLGGVAGAIVGNQSGHALEGAAIGTAIGAGAGYGIYRAKARRMRTAEQTRQAYKDWSEFDGLKLDVRDSRIEPSTVRPGSRATATMEYATLGTDGATVVEEKHLLMKDGELLAELETAKAERSDGTWEKEVVFNVPKKAEDGLYSITQEVTVAGQSSSVSTPFHIDSSVTRATTSDDVQLAQR